MTDIIAQWRRLFLHPAQRVNEQQPDGSMPAYGHTIGPGLLERHAAGKRTLVLRMIDASGLVRFGALDFDAATPEAWAAVCAARARVMAEGLPEPLVSSSGGKGYHLIIPMAEPVRASDMRQFLRDLRAVTCKGLPEKAVELRPDAEEDTGAAAGNLRLLPAFHQKAGQWGRFHRFADLAGQPPAVRWSRMTVAM
jgi:hypothetical protein